MRTCPPALVANSDGTPLDRHTDVTHSLNMDVISAMTVERFCCSASVSCGEASCM